MARQPSATRIRRFLHLLAQDRKGGSTLHKIDTEPFFAADASCHDHQSPSAGLRPFPLPRPVARFENFSQFFRLGRGGDVEKVVAVDTHRHTIIFDTRTTVVCAGSDLRCSKNLWAAWAEAGGRLYVLDFPRMFDDAPAVLGLGGPGHDPYRGDWFWNSLPSLPTGDSRFMSSFADGASTGAGAIMRVSMAWHGTFAFDVARGSWDMEGDWEMPFRGSAQYVADYGLWFGFSKQAEPDLCSADLNVDADAAEPAHRHVWTDIDGLADQANHFRGSYLSYLGCGRFCVTKFYLKMDADNEFAVVTAVQATRVAETGEIQMVRKGSKCYSLDSFGGLGWAY